MSVHTLPRHLTFPTTPREAWLRRHWIPRYVAWLDRSAEAWDRAREARSQAYFAQLDRANALTRTGLSSSTEPASVSALRVSIPFAKESHHGLR